jgi:hypothetical protein
MTKMNPRITCIECGDKFNRTTGDVDERTCLTCILKAEDPDVIKTDETETPSQFIENLSYAEDIDQQAFAQGRQSSITDVHNEKDLDVLEKISDKLYDRIEDKVLDKVYARIEKEEIRPVTYDNVILTGMDNKSYVQLEKKIRDNYLLVNDRVNELLERIVVIEKEIRE